MAAVNDNDSDSDNDSVGSVDSDSDSDSVGSDDSEGDSEGDSDSDSFMGDSVESAGSFRARVADTIDQLRADDEELTEVDALDYPLTSSEIDALADAVAGNTKVGKLRVKLDAYHPDSSAAVVSFLEKLLVNHPSLTEIWIQTGARYCFRYGPTTFMKVIAKAMKLNTSLKKINMMDCMITGTDAEELFKALVENTTLEELILSWNQITRCCSDISTFKNLSLKRLDLNSNRLGDDAVKAMFCGLQRNKSLKALQLISNNITDESCEAIAKTLQCNASLCNLCLGDNPITRNGATILEMPLHHTNASLVRFTIYSHVEMPPPEQITNSQVENIRQLVQKNRSIQHSFHLINENLQRLTLLGLWPQVLELVQTKPTILHKVLKLKPELFQEHRSRKRRHHDQILYG